jgi:acetate CoA/acetoacetate CoA-transferase alpha subunit
LKAKLTQLTTALGRIEDGMTLMVGGFLGVGSPGYLIDGLVRKGVGSLTVIANDTAFPDRGIGKLVTAKQIRRLVVSHIGTNPETGRQMSAGELAVELVPQGTLAERIRAGGAGLGGILTPVGLGTVVADGKEIICAGGREYLLELPLRADVAIIKAHKADTKGNLIFRCASRNFNPVMATAADYVVAETERLVRAGEIDPNEVMLPGLFVDAIVIGEASHGKRGES